jgi:hypothetical protein
LSIGLANDGLVREGGVLTRRLIDHSPNRVTSAIRRPL